MVKWITEDAKLRCKHAGKVQNKPSQDWVTIEGRKVLIQSDPEGRTITGCPNIGVNIKPCNNTLKVQKGYSEFIFVRIGEGRHSVCLDTISGLTDGTPPGTVQYVVADPGQGFVTEGS